MDRLILIKKINQADFVHYYAVYEEDSLNKITYYMELDNQKKKISFFLTKEFINSFCIYNVNESKFEKEPDQASLLKSNSIIKGIKAIKNNDFPSDISYIA